MSREEPKIAQISDFKAKLKTGGARPNQFRVVLSFPTRISTSSDISQTASFLCRSATLPSSTVDDIRVQYRGREVHFAGERSFQPWTISIYNDNDFMVRNQMETWSHYVQELTTTFGTIAPAEYQATLYVHQLNRMGNAVKTYYFVNAFPIEIGAIRLDYEQVSVIEEFDVTFVYDYWTTDKLTYRAPVVPTEGITSQEVTNAG